MSNEIIEELHRVREQLWEECGGNIDVLDQRAHESAIAHGFKYSDLKPQVTKLVRPNIATA